MKFTVRLLALLLVAATAFTLVGCHKKGETVMTVGDVTISSGLYVAFQLEGFQSFKTKIDEQVQSASSDGTLTTDAPQSYEEYLERSYEGQTAKDYINAYAQEAALKYAWVDTQFKSVGLEFTATETAYINAYAQQEWENVKALYQPSGVSYETFLDYYTYSNTSSPNKTSKLFFYYYDEKDEETGLGGVEAVAEDKLVEEMDKTYILADVMEVALTTTSADGTTSTAKTEDEVKQIKKDLNALAKRINKGEKFDKIYEEYMGSAPQSNMTETGIEEKTIYPETAFLMSSNDSNTSSFFTKFDEQRKADGFKYKKAYVLGGEDDGYYYLAVFYDIAKDPYYLAYNRSMLLQSLMGDTYVTKVETGAKAMTANKNEKLLKHYQPSKFVFDDVVFQAAQ